MPFIIVVGGQFGSEGKGKTTAHLCKQGSVTAAVRCGGPNSGHTVTVDGEQVVLRQLPAGVVDPSTKLFLAAGCLLDLSVLREEIERFGIEPTRLRIDKHVVIIEREWADEEQRLNLRGRVGSTCSGTGVAVARRALRDNGLRLAADVPELAPYLADVSQELMAIHARGGHVVVEGTQGYGLSVYHSPYYPHATSRDTTAAAFLSEVGVSPRLVAEVIMVVRTFPIRVSGNSGPLPNEVDWETVRRESAYPIPIAEFTSVTRRLRRVARFDLDIVKRAALVNSPTQIALMGTDYLDYRNRAATHFEGLTDAARIFIDRIEEVLSASATLIGTGPFDHELIDRSRVQNIAQATRVAKTKALPLS